MYSSIVIDDHFIDVIFHAEGIADCCVGWLHNWVGEQERRSLEGTLDPNYAHPLLIMVCSSISRMVRFIYQIPSVNVLIAWNLSCCWYL